jgi:periplasmic protein TonB
MPTLTAPPPPQALQGQKTYLRKRKSSRLPLWTGTLLCTAGIFLLLPFSQMIAALGKKPNDLFTVEVAVQPPPPPPPDLEPPEPPPPEPPPPDMQPPPQQLSLSQMDVALNLGVGDAMAGAFSFDGFGVSAEDTAGDLQIFDVKDLDSVPRRTRTATLIHPPPLRTARIAGAVTLMIIISENGGVQVEKVVNSTHREFEANAIRFAEGCQFEPPMKGGQAVKARYTWPIRFDL